MWISSVDLPDELVSAARSGELVIFVGAGASMDAPASLPSFVGLTRDIADDARFAYEESDLYRPDELLGRIGDGQVDVHRQVRRRINRPESSPNALHEAIVDLAAATKAPRIVTTNFDLHLSSVIEARGLEWGEYTGPALPMGHEFEGVVYLHGSLRQPASQLVVTDSDFGAAYLTDAWAARFLERMFATFTVLFVGYSHGDVVMQYLGRALPPTSRRFVLVAGVPETRWRRLRITPVSYEVEAGPMLR